MPVVFPQGIPNSQARAILESITDGFLALDRRWRFTYINETGARMIGMSREQLVGGCVWELLPHAKSTKFESEYRRAVDSRSPVHFEEFYPEPLNLWLECHCYPSPQGLSVCFRDVTARRAAEEQIRVLSHFPAENPDPVLRVTPEGRLVYANPASAPLLQLWAVQVGQTLPDPVIRAVREVLSSAAPGQLEVPCGSRVLLLSLAPVAEGPHVNLYGQDITEIREAERTLRAFNETLEERVAERTAELQAAHEALLARSRDLDAFFHHSLTPLVFLDREFNFIRVNEAYARACQRQVEEFPGLNHFDLYPSDAKAIFEEVVRTRKPHQVFAQPFSFPDHPDWGVTYWDWTLTPLVDAQGEVEALVFALEDVTARRRVEEELRRLNATLEQRAAQLQALALQLSEAEEHIRGRIADVLHDDLQQLLASLRFHLSSIRPDVVAIPGSEEALQQVDGLLEEALRKCRVLSHELSPAGLRHSGLAAAVQWLAGRMREQHGLQVRVDLEGWREAKEAPLRIFLFRAVQEMLFNVAKHAGVDQAVVRLRRPPDRLEAVVEDAGRGFDPGILDVPEGGGMGLFSIRERVKYLGGSLSIETAPGGGSRLTLSLPEPATMREGASQGPMDTFTGRSSR